MTEERILQLYREADAFLNVTGAQEIREEHLTCPRRIYVESDPFVSQVKVAQGDAATIRALAGHDTYFSFGENLGAADCDVPVQQFRWLPTRQAGALGVLGHPQRAPAENYTTITPRDKKSKNKTYQGGIY